MGFDPRSPGRQPWRGVVTSNVDTLLAENDALRREVRRLRQQLQELQLDRDRQGRPVSEGDRHGITAEQVERWGIAMARHPRWRELRVGPPGGLRGLVEERERRGHGLGAELTEALRGPHSRVRWAVRAAFALHGQRAPEWLSDAPLRLVDDLLRLATGPRRPGSRTENHSGSPPEAAGDPRTAAMRLMGLEPGASLAAIKRAYRRLAKAHHPDLGGDAEAFHQLDAAYRLLIG
ncbi:MAG: J domain-containing protein [Cyanobacteriota bacterium]|nr:J domain-containing protein [Cyanobacteriota bacterium]